jgi:hypothetical protein
MKITLEIPDPTPTPAPEAKDKSTPKAVSASDETTAPTIPSPPTTKKQSPPTVAEKLIARAERTTPVPSDLGVAKDQATQPEEEKPSQSAVSNNPLHSFDLQGGVNDILDPGRGNPAVYQFVQPKGEA